MQKILLSLTTLLMAITLCSCDNEILGEPDEPVWPEGLVKKIIPF